MSESDKLVRLTEREKECLRAWLDHKTAKEMALDLGISHHAVEKRLKRARRKLGVASSIEAARQLAESEGYGRTVSHPTDLATGRTLSQHRSNLRTIGVLAMSVLAATIIALALQSSGNGDDAKQSEPSREIAQGEFRMRPASDFVDASTDEVRAYAEQLFREQDKDRSGYIERDESPTPQIRLTEDGWDGEGPAPYEWYEKQKTQVVALDPVAARAAFVALGDTNADGKLSLDEFIERYRKGLNGQQVPVTWREQRLAER